MRDKELYAQILGITPPWIVREVELALPAGEVIVHLDLDFSPQLTCPVCGEASAGYDTRPRRWRHLDTCQYRTVIAAEVPRVQCPDHGVHQISVPWAEPGGRFSALFEALAIDWMKEASLLGVCRLLGLSWDEAGGIQERAVKRGLERREELARHRSLPSSPEAETIPRGHPKQGLAQHAGPRQRSPQLPHLRRLRSSSHRQGRRLYADEDFGKELQEATLFALDATTIVSVCHSFPGLTFDATKPP